MDKALPPGATLQKGRYTIEKVLGQGSFGVTYRASTYMEMTGELGSLRTKVTVAIKEFFMDEMNNRSNASLVGGSDISLVQNYRRKFRKEAENLSHLSHPNIVRVLSIFDENNTSYYVMEYLDGESLDQRIVRMGNLPEEEAVEAIRQIGGALQHMHEHRMLHLDMKPSNVMCTSDGRIVLIDFGLSKQYDSSGEPESSTTLGLGTKGYAPIEQADYRQDGTFPTTLDIYALGATLFKALTGKRPLPASELMNEETFIRDNLTAAGISEQTTKAVCKAMSFRKRDRQQTVAEFLRSLPQPGQRPDEEEKTEFRRNEGGATPQPSLKAKAKQEDQPESPSHGPEAGRAESKGKRQSTGGRNYLIAGIIIVAVLLAIIVAVFMHGDDTAESERPAIMRVEKMATKAGLWSGRISADSVPDGRGELRYYDDDPDGRSSYTGEMSRGMRHGKGILIYNNGITFDGTFENDELNEGTFKDPSQNSYFEGKFFNNSPYEGEWRYLKDDKRFATVRHGEATYQ